MSKLRYIAFFVFAVVALSSCTKSAWMGDAEETVTLRSASDFIGTNEATTGVTTNHALSTQTRNGGTTDVVSDDNSGGITDDEDDNGNTKKKTNK